MNHIPHRAGLGRAEVVTVLVLLLVVAGVGLVALRHSWETSYRVRCMENLKLIGLGVTGYQDRHRQLPASGIAPGYATWAVLVAPDLPEPAAGGLTAWDLEETYYRQSAEVRLAQVSFFYCPARRRPPQRSVGGDVAPDAGPEAANVPGALGDYAACAGDGIPPVALVSPEANGALVVGKVMEKVGGRILRWSGRTGLTDLPRGLSNTLLVGEKHVPWGHFGVASSGDGSLYNGGNALSYARFGGPGHGLAAGPTAPLQDNFGSYHAGICHFLLADQSVRAVADGISPEVLGRLANRYE